MLPVSKADDGATIRCEAEHPALQEALSARKLLTIHCKHYYYSSIALLSASSLVLNQADIS